MTDLAEYLELEQELVDELELYDLLGENYGNSGDMLYNYTLNIPEEMPPEVLEQKGWKVGQLIVIPLSVVDSEDVEW